MPFLKVNSVSKQEQDGFILKDISFSQRRGEKVVVAGETGSGKSTLLKIIAGLVQPDKGEVYFEDKRVQGPDEKLVAGDPAVAYLSQNFELQKFLRVEQVLAYANLLADEEADELFRICQIDHLLKRKTDQLSGGERQRIALAKLLISSPTLLLLDEPFSHLDMPHKNTLKEVIDDVSKKLKITCILVSHDPDDTLSWADKIVVLKNGEMIQKGDAQKIYREPVNEYVAGLFGEYNLIPIAEFKKLFKNSSDLSKGKVLLRPEDISVNGTGNSPKKAHVNSVRYYGGFTRLLLSLGDSQILASTADNGFEPGEKVNIACVKKDIHTLK